VMVKKSVQFWLIKRHKCVEIFNFLNCSRIVNEIMMNLFSFLCIFKKCFLVWCEKGKDPDPEPDPKLIISDPDP